MECLAKLGSWAVDGIGEHHVDFYTAAVSIYFHTENIKNIWRVLQLIKLFYKKSCQFLDS